MTIVKIKKKQQLGFRAAKTSLLRGHLSPPRHVTDPQAASSRVWGLKVWVLTMASPQGLLSQGISPPSPTISSQSLHGLTHIWGWGFCTGLRGHIWSQTICSWSPQIHASLAHKTLHPTAPRLLSSSNSDIHGLIKNHLNCRSDTQL